MTDRYDARYGVPIDHSFLSHVAHCKQCQQYDESKPATAARLCLAGSVLVKMAAPRPKSQRATMPSNRASKDEIRRLTRYVGD